MSLPLSTNPFQVLAEDQIDSNYSLPEGLASHVSAVVPSSGPIFLLASQPSLPSYQKEDEEPPGTINMEQVLESSTLSARVVGGSVEGSQSCMSPKLPTAGEAEHWPPLRILVKAVPESISPSNNPASSPDSIPPLINGLVSKLKHIDGTPSLSTMVSPSLPLGVLSNIVSEDPQLDQAVGPSKASRSHGRGSRRLQGSKFGTSPPSIP